MIKREKIKMLMSFLNLDDVVWCYLVINITVTAFFNHFGLENWAWISNIYLGIAFTVYLKTNLRTMDDDRRYKLITAMLFFTIGSILLFYQYEQFMNNEDKSFANIRVLSGAALVFLMLSKSGEILYEEILTDVVVQAVKGKVPVYWKRNFVVNVNKPKH